jgi:hypothetical protein
LLVLHFPALDTPETQSLKKTEFLYARNKALLVTKSG